MGIGGHRMSEVEKMYEKVGLESHFCKYPRFCDDNNCNNCPNYSSEFTAEKQLEVIKWLIKYDELHADFNDNEYGFSTLNYSGKYKKDFEEALAAVINRELWQDLTEEEQEQIKRILE